MNNTIINKTMEVTPSVVWKDIIFLSSWLVRKLVYLFTKWGIPLKEYQIRVAGVIVDLILIFIVIKLANRIGKPIIVLALLFLLVWFLIGFFI